MSKGEQEVDEELERIRKKKLQQLKYEVTHPKEDKPKFDTGGKVYWLSVLNFWELVRKYTKVVIECYADWCRPCKALEPILMKLASMHREILFAKLDIDKSAVIADQFQVQGVPTILFFRNGSLVDRQSGAIPIKTIEAHIRKFLG
ncbi:MAG: thioredoxin family protein [Candidatus Helarchaeota archaeon]|nr:thioredoxin family protein [Candidatus Helarchaeota archaeon]